MTRLRNRLTTLFTPPSGGWVLYHLNVLLLIGAVGAAGAVVWSLIDMFTSSTLSGLPMLLKASQLANSLPDGVVLNEAEVSVTVVAGLGHRMAWWLTGSAHYLLFVLGLVSLRRVVTTAQAGDPFIAANVKRLRFVASLATTYFVLSAARRVVSVRIQADLAFENPVATLPLGPIYIAIALQALAEIWRRGVDLREEHRLTV